MTYGSLAPALLAFSTLAACGGDGSGAPDPDAALPVDGQTADSAVVDTPPAGPFTLTSPMLTEGAQIAEANTCDGPDTSPQLAWTNPPPGTMSFAVVLTDKTINNFVHSVIYDIPATATGLPANVAKTYEPANVPGAHQTAGFNGTRGYAGPCPPVGAPHTYEFAVYALNVAPLPGATMQTTRAQAVTAIQANDLAVARLTGTYTTN